MILNVIKTNMTEVDMGNIVVLFSYKTPVVIIDREERIAYITDYKYSNTTTRHINHYYNLRIKHCVDSEFGYTVKSITQKAMNGFVYCSSLAIEK